MTITPSYFIPETKETVLIKPTGVMQFFGESGMTMTSITFSSETAALEYAKERRWKEVPLP